MQVIERNKWVVAQRESGINVSERNGGKNYNTHVKISNLLIQLPYLEVQYSERPELEPLTLNHMQGPLALLAFALVVAAVTFLVEIGGRLLNDSGRKRQKITEMTTEIHRKRHVWIQGEVIQVEDSGAPMEEQYGEKTPRPRDPFVPEEDL